MHFVATISSKGQITLPARLRDKLKLEEGDKVEFYVDHKGRVMILLQCLRFGCGAVTLCDDSRII